MALLTIDQADEYFDSHLFADAWELADGDKCRAAIAHAERDIKTLNYPQGVDGPSAADLRAAICEQALYLLDQAQGGRERIRAQETGVISRSVGDAREHYTGKPGHIAPEAMRILGRYFRVKTGRIL